ncbi:MAG: endolytic transglycosylase MltG [Candidatus Marinimicrobia bacterium]|nr:endolytic transglycosylase MltG [Candidatus Neomarinimicrobiota bacterium]
MFYPKRKGTFAALKMARRHNYRYDKLAGFCVSLAVATAVAFYSLVVFWPQPHPETPVRIEVQKGATLGEIAQSLKMNHVIDNAKPFILATQLMGYETSIQAGVFSLTDIRSNFQIIHQLVNGTPVIQRVTILEGMRMREVAELFSEKLGTDIEQFMELCADQRFVHSLGIDASTLEGFLFPETYRLPEGEQPKKIIEMIVGEYQQIMDDSVRQRMKQLNLTELETVILASIIEGEAIYNSERPIISAVYHNRLKKGMRLQADPTIQYIIDDSPRRLLNEDLKIESPYNTYLNYGLPPGPINNPGEESILAALYPADVSYFFFVANGEGYHTFSETEAQHIKAKKEYQKYRRKMWREKSRKIQSQ